MITYLSAFDMTASTTPTISQFTLEQIPSKSLNSNNVLGYFAQSTAPLNVDEQPPEEQDCDVNRSNLTHTAIDTIAQHLAKDRDSHAEIVISIHGYGTQQKDAKDRYEKIFRYSETICHSGATVFIGYLWPSEKPTGKYAFQALPIFPSRIFRVGLLLSGAIAFLLAVTSAFEVLFIVLLVGAVSAFAIILALILLRLSTYFRDNYRATNFGVPDLVELIRYLDQAIDKVDPTIKNEDNDNKRVKLTFIGHSMGCFVVTNTIRILSDVFDNDAIDKKPDSNIGQVFTLSRLILIAPDIPVETIMPRRANFLRSALRRCTEAYIFTNEADLALRLASTAANYFSFPSSQRYSGHRLGNLNVARPLKKSEPNNLSQKLGDKDYGIVNAKPQGEEGYDSPFDHLQIRSSDGRNQRLNEIRELSGIEKENLGTGALSNVPVSDLFTYFDCTDYVDYQGNLVDDEGNLVDDRNPAEITKDEPRGIVSYALRQSALSFADYRAVSVAYFLKFPNWMNGVVPKPINTHGGYFDGVLSQKLFCNLAFMGFQKTLQLLSTQEQLQNVSLDQLSVEDKRELLHEFSKTCQSKGIQVVLAPIRYEQDVLEKNLRLSDKP